MTMQTTAFSYSLGIHGFILLLVLGLGQWPAPPRVVRIDFTLYETRETGTVQGPESAPASRVSSVRHENAKPRHRTEIKQKERAEPVTEKFKPESQVIVSSESRVAVPPPHTSIIQSDAGQINERRHDPAARTGSMTDTGNTGTDSRRAAELSKGKYLRQHFSYIRDLIMAKLGYPDMARRMGWSGQVRVGFLIQEDGCVRNVRVISSSGFELLDRNAVETVKKASPFPRPPVEADIVMPIAYRLN